MQSSKISMGCPFSLLIVIFIFRVFICAGNKCFILDIGSQLCEIYEKLGALTA